MSIEATEAAPAVLSGADRRRAPRFSFRAPVQVRWSGGCLAGYSHDLSQCGMLIQGVGDIPEEGVICDVVMELAPHRIEANGVVARRDASRSRFALELRQVHSDAQVLLNALLLAGAV